MTLATFVRVTVSDSNTRQSRDCTCLGHLGRRDINRNDLSMSLCPRQPRQVQACRCPMPLSLALLHHLHQCEHRIYISLSVSHNPRWPRQVNSDCRVLLSLTVTLTNVANVSDPLEALGPYSQHFFFVTYEWSK